jgi:hypothetical protein
MATDASPVSVIYRIDAEDRITYVNPAWIEFARDNHGDAVMPELVLGRNLLASVANTTVRQLYERIIQRVRGGKSVRFRYRCDAPDRRRFFVMDVSLASGGEVEFSSTLTREEKRAPVALLEPGRLRGGGSLRICSLCQRVAMPDRRWLQVEEAVDVLHLLEAEHLPAISHAICEQCYSVMIKATEPK